MGNDSGKSIALSRRSSNRAPSTESEQAHLPSKESEQAHLPLDEKSGDVEAIQTSDDPSVPYASKARRIALVLTLTGAAFLNVPNHGLNFSRNRSGLTLPTDPLGSSRRNCLAHHWRKSQHSPQPPAMDRLGLLSDVRLLSAPLGSSCRRLRQAPNIHLWLRVAHCRHDRHTVLTE